MAVAVESYLPEVEGYAPQGKQAGGVVVGDVIRVADPQTLLLGEATVSATSRAQAQGIKITTVDNISLICSSTAQIPTRRDRVLLPEQLLSKEVAVYYKQGDAWYVDWQMVGDVVATGLTNVQHITVINHSFWAGQTTNAFILHVGD